MAQETQVYKRSVAGSIGAGVKSVFGGNGKTYYILVHRVTTLYHKAGESQPIIVDQIELGRDPKCQVRFDENFQTVSRRHAAIVRDGDNWKLVQLSKTNSTYLNGRKVQNEWYLQNGDEIQLSTNGPKLGFIVPQGENGKVSSIGLTNRLSLFRQQALRPYKKALWSIVAVLAAVCIAGGLLLSNTNHKLKGEQEYIRMAEKQWSDEKNQMQETMAQMEKNNADLSAKLEKSKKDISKLQGDIKSITSKPVPSVKTTVDNSVINACMPYVYFIYSTGFEVSYEGKQGVLECGKDVPGWSGTGFLLSNGRFVTARHVIEAWNFPSDEDDPLLELNYIKSNGGKVVAHFNCVSASGSSFSCTSDQFVINKSHDEYVSLEDGTKLCFATLDDTDYAYCKTSLSGGLSFNSQRSSSLEMGTKLTVLGFPYGLGANSPTDIRPIYGSAVVASDGLQKGVILTTDTNYEHGNSGGPVFYSDANGNMVTVGLVSAGTGRNLGFIVPMSAIR